ncbi:hypothetical protein GJ496_008353 [Pomphorhynchus laevis]|nr:hypothetical protein GJ496_008353 [Pomphorhynchus laevis]
MVLTNAFVNLKNFLPWVPNDTKLSKLVTLRMAINYIAHLMKILDNCYECNFLYDENKQIVIPPSWSNSQWNHKFWKCSLDYQCNYPQTAKMFTYDGCLINYDCGGLVRNEICYAPEPPVQHIYRRRRLPTPPPNIYQKTVVVRPARKVIHEVVEKPVCPPPIVKMNYVMGPASPDYHTAEVVPVCPSSGSGILQNDIGVHHLQNDTGVHHLQNDIGVHHF